MWINFQNEEAVDSENSFKFCLLKRIPGNQEYSPSKQNIWNGDHGALCPIKRKTGTKFLSNSHKVVPERHPKSQAVIDGYKHPVLLKVSEVLGANSLQTLAGKHAKTPLDQYLSLLVFRTANIVSRVAEFDSNWTVVQCKPLKLFPTVSEPRQPSLIKRA